MIKWYMHIIIHKLWVMWYIFLFCLQIMGRAITHDLSKFGHDESKSFSQNLKQLSKVTYGSAEYKENLSTLEPTLNHHYKHNRHHPEHWEHGLLEMDLYDIVEMQADWLASIKKNGNGNIFTSLRVNKSRVGLSHQLHKIISNTYDPK